MRPEGRQGDEFSWWIAHDRDDPDPLIQTAAAVQRIEEGKKVYVVYVHGDSKFLSATWHQDYAACMVAQLNDAAEAWYKSRERGRKP